MRALKIGLVSAAWVCVLLLALTTSALALELPDMHALSTEEYPVLGKGEVKGTEVATLETELGERLGASSMALEVNLSELSSLGSYVMTLTGILEPRTKTTCNTAGDTAGTALLPGEYHVVDTSTSPLTVVLLLLFKELVLECNSGKFKIKVRGPLLVKLQKTNKEPLLSDEDQTQYQVVEKCPSKGKQELKEYLNDEGTKVKAVLTENVGLGFETACENVTEDMTVTLNKMVVFLF